MTAKGACVPANTHAVIVGVEAYAAGPDWEELLRVFDDQLPWSRARASLRQNPQASASGPACG